MTILCPNCHAPLDLTDASTTDVHCPSCGLVASRTVLSLLAPAKRKPSVAIAIAAIVLGSLCVTGLSAVVWQANTQWKTTAKNLQRAKEAKPSVKYEGGGMPESFADFQKMLDYNQERVAADPTNALAQRGVGFAAERLGDLKLEAGQVTEALEYYQKGLEINQKLVAADPTNDGDQLGLSWSYERLGDASLQAGQVTEALGYYQKSLPIKQKFAAADPTHAQLQFQFYCIHDKIGSVHQKQKQKQYKQAIESYDRGLKILQSLEEQKRLPSVAEKWIGIAEQAIQVCRNLQEESSKQQE